jgi:hypothetical protein
MLECSIAKAIFMGGPLKEAPKETRVEVLYSTVLSCELNKLERFIQEHNNDLDGLIALIDTLSTMVNSRDLLVSARKFSGPRGASMMWGVVCEFRLVRTQKILLLSTMPELGCTVIEYKPGTAGVKSSESPALLMKQIGKIAGLPRYFSGPPLGCAV